MDTHLHIKALSRRDIEPDEAKSIAAIQRMLRAKAKELGPGEWITGYGWDEAQLTEKRNLTREDLDAAAPDNPVALTRAGGALRRWKLTGVEDRRHRSQHARSQIGAD